MPGQNGDKPKQRKSKRRHHNGDNPKWRQDEGNITKTATEKCGQNGDKRTKDSQGTILPQNNVERNELNLSSV